MDREGACFSSRGRKCSEKFTGISFFNTGGRGRGADIDSDLCS